MNYTIYQMPLSVRRNKSGLWNSDSIVERMDYLPVYKGNTQTTTKTDTGILDELFDTFNINHPKDFASNSMSAGDVIQLNDKDFYLCCTIGWHRLGENF